MLIITEKPSVAKQFASALGAKAKEPFVYQDNSRTYTITHCRGHLLEMCNASQYDMRMKKWNYASLPVLPQEFLYEVIPESKKILQTVVKMIDKAVKAQEEIMIATDAGREGEVIARLVLGYAKADKYTKLSRFWVSESTAEPQVVHDGIKNRTLLSNYDKLAHLGLSWKKSDWIYGINLTVLFTLLGQREMGFKEEFGLMNTGRVQTAILYEIYRREKEIAQFKAKPYSRLEIATEDGLRAYLVHSASEDNCFFTEGSADKHPYIAQAEQALTRSRSVMVKKVVIQTDSDSTPLLFTTSELQKEAYRVYGYTPVQTLQLMQKLYEENGTLSYPRTPSQVLGEGNEQLAQSWINSQLEREPEWKSYINLKKYTLMNKRLFNNAKLEDHYGLVPLKYMEDDGSDAYKVWKLVQVRFLMQGMEPYVVERTKIRLEQGEFAFIGNFGQVVRKGWKQFVIRKREDKEETLLTLHSPVREGMTRNTASWRIVRDSTKPPRLHNYASIIAFMQNPKDGQAGNTKLVGIGTEATRAAHVKGLETHKMIENRKGLVATGKGKKLLSMIVGIKELAVTVQAAETTEWETLGENDPAMLLEKTKELVRCVVQSVEAPATAGQQSLGKCPKCGKDVFIGQKTYFCAGYKDAPVGCDFVVWRKTDGSVITPEMAQKLLQGEVVEGVICTTKAGKRYTASYRLGDTGNVIQRR